MGTGDADRPLAVLVGAGPGDPGLVSREGADWLTIADVVIYDRLVNPELLSLCRSEAELIYVGKDPSRPSVSQERINALIIEKARQGRLVVRLKGGDPFVFGRGGEEAQALSEAGVPFRVVPGITAAVAAGAYAGIPLTDRRLASTVVFVTGQEDPLKDEAAIDWSAVAGIDTIVLYMGVASLERVARRLMEAGRDGATPAAIVEWASTPRQRTVTASLATLAEEAARAGIKPPAVTIVGRVVDLRRAVAWFEELPLFGRTILVTRARRQASALAGRLRGLGAAVIEAPAIAIEPVEDAREMDDAIGRLAEFDWLVLTSANGVEALFDRMWSTGLDARRLGGLKVAAVGAATAEALRRRSIRADLVPEAFTTESLGSAMACREELRGKRVLLARADIAPPGLAEALRQAGASVEEVAAYRTVRPPALPDAAAEALRGGGVDWITFTSSSTVENFLALAAADRIDLGRAKLAAIGPVTAEALRKRGLAPAVVAQPHTIDALVEAMAAFEQSAPATPQERT